MREGKKGKEREEGKTEAEKDKRIQNPIHVKGMMDHRRWKTGKERNGGKIECNQTLI